MVSSWMFLSQFDEIYLYNQINIKYFTHPLEIENCPLHTTERATYIRNARKMSSAPLLPYCETTKTIKVDQFLGASYIYIYTTSTLAAQPYLT